MTPLELIELRRIFAVVMMVFSIVLLIVMLRHLALEIWHNRRGWWLRLGNQAAVATSVFMFGEILSRFWGWIIYGNLIRGRDIGELENTYPLGMMATLIISIGLMFLIVVYSPRVAWIIGAISAAVAATIFILVVS